jgi:hypothetical protein
MFAQGQCSDVGVATAVLTSCKSVLCDMQYGAHLTISSHTNSGSGLRIMFDYQ